VEKNLVKSANGKILFSEELAAECIRACGAGFTLEKCAGLIGVPLGTLKTWTHRKPSFAVKMETARKKYELDLLQSVQMAGQRAWQAHAWILERTFGHSVPSARLQVSASHEHSLGGNLAAMLAGIASKRGEKQAEVIECEQVKDKPVVKTLHNSYCATNETQTIATTIPKKIKKVRHLAMRRRKPRAESLAKYADTTTPTPGSPAPI